jgi:hypothetical protein
MQELYADRLSGAPSDCKSDKSSKDDDDDDGFGHSASRKVEKGPG